MSQEMKTIYSEGNTGETDSSWKSLYKTGGVAALLATLLFLTDIIVLTTMDPAPETARDWFALLQNDRATGIIELFFSDLFGLALVFPIVIALYAALRRSNWAYAALAAVLTLAGISIVFAASPNYALISLSDQYATAPTDAHKAQLLAAGEAVLATGMDGTGVLVGGFLAECGLLILSAIMLPGKIFSKWIAWVGILAHGLDVAHSIVFLIFIPLFGLSLALSVGTPFLAVGGTLQLIWYPLVARRLWQLGRQ